MNLASVDHSQRNLYAVYLAVALIAGGIAVGLQASVPEEIADYVSNGFTLPVFRYGLLFPLIACGVILSGERQPIALVVHLGIFVSAIWLGIEWAGPIVYWQVPWGGLIAKYPVLTTVMGLVTGGALLLPLRARRWLVPVVSASCGLGLGLSIDMESPGDYYPGWFSSAGGLGGIAIVIASSALAGGAQRIDSGSWFVVGGRILGSWLIAASLMLGALALVPTRPIEPVPIPMGILEEFDLMRQP